MSDRLDELRRQRALLTLHLAWLDREIAAAEKPSPSTPALPAVPRVMPEAPVVAIPPSPAVTSSPALAAPGVTPTATLPSPPVAPDVDLFVEQNRVEPDTLRQDVRKGCFLYFAAALVLLAAAVAVLYVIVPHREPPSRENASEQKAQKPAP